MPCPLSHYFRGSQDSRGILALRVLAGYRHFSAHEEATWSQQSVATRLTYCLRTIRELLRDSSKKAESQSAMLAGVPHPGLRRDLE